MNKPKIIAICSESSGGKNHLFERLIKESNILPTVSHTTRKPRLGEIEGKDYYFINQETFDNMETYDKFIETRVYNTKHEGIITYGLAKSEIDLTNEDTYVIIVDLKGLEEVKQYVPNTVGIYLRTSVSTRINRSVNRQKIEIEKQYSEGNFSILTEIFNRIERDREDFKDVKNKANAVFQNETLEDLEFNIRCIKSLIGEI